MRFERQRVWLPNRFRFQGLDHKRWKNSLPLERVSFENLNYRLDRRGWPETGREKLKMQKMLGMKNQYDHALSLPKVYRIFRSLLPFKEEEQFLFSQLRRKCDHDRSKIEPCFVRHPKLSSARNQVR